MNGTIIINKWNNFNKKSVCSVFAQVYTVYQIFEITHSNFQHESETVLWKWIWDRNYRPEKKKKQKQNIATTTIVCQCL